MMGRRRASLGDGNPVLSRNGGPYNRSSSVPRNISTVNSSAFPLPSTTTTATSAVRNRAGGTNSNRNSYLQPANRSSLPQDSTVRPNRQSVSRTNNYSQNPVYPGPAMHDIPENDGLPTSPAASSAGGEQSKHRNSSNYRTLHTGLGYPTVYRIPSTTVTHTVHKGSTTTNTNNNTTTDNTMGNASANVWAHIYKPLPVNTTNGNPTTKIPPPTVPNTNHLNKHNNNHHHHHTTTMDTNKPVPLTKSSSSSSSAQNASRTNNIPNQRSPGAAVTGMTRSEILSSKTPDLANYLQNQINLLFHRTAEDSSPYVHSIRQINEMVTEVLARWRKSTTLALNSIDSLESELAKKIETITEISTKYTEKLTDKDTIIASLEAEKETLRIYAQRLEVHLGRMIEATAQITEASNNASSHDPTISNPSSLPAPLVAALKELLSAARTDYRHPSVNLTTAHHHPNTVADVEGLKAAVKEGTDNVVQFFADFDANYSSSASSVLSSIPRTEATPILPAGASSASETKLQPSTTTTAPHPPSLSIEHQQALKNIDSTLQRALAFTAQQNSNQKQSSNPTASSASVESVTTNHINTSPVAHNHHTHKAEPNTEPNKSTSLPPTTSTTTGKKILSLDIELDPVMHSRATVGQLRTAISIKAGRKPLSLSINGKSLGDDTAKLTDIGVPVKATIEVIFDEPNTTSNANAINATLASVINSHNKKPPVPVQPTLHVPKPAQPLSVPSKLSPPTSKQPLTSPAPHRAPRELSTVVGTAGEEPNTVTPSDTATTVQHRIHDGDDDDDTSPLPVPSLSKLQHTTKLAIPVPLSSTDNGPTTVSVPSSSVPSLTLPSSPSPVSSSSTSSLSTNKSPLLIRTETVRLNDNNGKVTGSLLHAALAHPSQDGQREIIIRSIFNTVDRDGSGSLSLKELENYVAAVQKILQRNTTDSNEEWDDTNTDERNTLPGGSPSSFYTAEDIVDFDTPMESTTDMALTPGFTRDSTATTTTTTTTTTQRSGSPRKRLSRTVSSASVTATDIDTALAADGVPLALHAAFCSVLAESGSLATAFIELDRNHDGSIDFEEFRTVGDAMFLRADDKVDIARRTALEREQRLSNLDSAKKLAYEAEQAKLAELRAIHAEYEAIEATERKLREAAALAMTSGTNAGNNNSTNAAESFSFEAIRGLSNQRKQFSPKALPPSLPPPSDKQSSLSPSASLIPKPKLSPTNGNGIPASLSPSSSVEVPKMNGGGMFISQPASSIPVPRKLSPLVKSRPGSNGGSSSTVSPSFPPPPPPPPSRKGGNANP